MVRHVRRSEQPAMKKPRSRSVTTTARDEEEQRVRACARALLERARARWPAASTHGPVNLEQLAELLDATIEIDPLAGASARLLQIDGRAKIFVSDHDTDPGAVRFSIAHELGHLALGHTVAALGVDTSERGQLIERLCVPNGAGGGGAARAKGQASARDIEREADWFASELLLPTPVAAPWCVPAPITLEPIRTLARVFGASLFAATMRYVELSPECCCVVYCDAGRVRWAKSSATWRTWMPRGRSLDPRAAAFDYFQPGGFAAGGGEITRAVELDTWIPRAAIQRAAAANANLATTEPAPSPPIEITEHAIAFPRRGAAFSVLWMPRPL